MKMMQGIAILSLFLCTACSSSTKVPPSIAEPQNVIFHEDFRGTEEGLVPNGWSTDTGVGVVRMGLSTKGLGQLKQGKHKIMTPPVSLPPNFSVDINVLWGHDGYMNQMLKISVGKVTATIGGGYYSDSVGLTNSSTIKGSAAPYEGKRSLFVLEKRGPVFRLYADGKQLILSRVPDFEANESVPIVVEADSVNFCIFSLSARKMSD